MRLIRIAVLLGLVAGQLGLVQGQSVSLAPGSPSTLPPTEQALRLYGALTHKTILRPTMLPQLSESLVAEMMADTNAAAGVLEKALADRRIEMVRDGELFVRLLPEGWQTSTLAAQLLRIPSPPKRETNQNERASASVSMPAGTIDFRNVGIDQALAVYASLCNRTVLRPHHLSASVIALRTETALSREEAVYAMNVVLALNGVATVEDGVNFVQVVPMPRMALAKARAPKPKLTEPLIKPEEVPVFVVRPMLFPPHRPAAKAEAADHLPPPPAPPVPPGVDDLVAYYAKLVGQKASASGFRQQPVSLKVQNPLTKAELLYAIETTLALDDIKIERQDDGTLQAVAK